jgi:hypothetical protein
MLFRSDGWVKTVLGQAIAGAQVYVCTQPANLVNPPTPLASIFADPLGNAPITQPVPTDGFGHYDFYVAYGTYAIIVINGGNIQTVYPDQTFGFPVGSSGTVTNDEGSLVAGALIIGNGGSDIETGPAFPGNASLFLNGVGNFSVPPTLVAAGQNVASPPFNTANITLPAGYISETYCQLVPQNQIMSYPARWTISVIAPSSTPTTQWGVARTLPGSYAVIDITPITFQSGNASPTLASGLNTSDAISLQIDNAHDYWFFVYGTTNVQLNCSSAVGANVGAFVGGYMNGSPYDWFTASPTVVPNPPVPSGNFTCWLYAWQAHS